MNPQSVHFTRNAAIGSPAMLSAEPELEVAGFSMVRANPAMRRQDAAMRSQLAEWVDRLTAEQKEDLKKFLGRYISTRNREKYSVLRHLFIPFHSNRPPNNLELENSIKVDLGKELTTLDLNAPNAIRNIANAAYYFYLNARDLSFMSELRYDLNKNHFVIAIADKKERAKRYEISVGDDRQIAATIWRQVNAQIALASELPNIDAYK